MYKKAPAQERDPTFAPLPVFEFRFSSSFSAFASSPTPLFRLVFCWGFWRGLSFFCTRNGGFVTPAAPALVFGFIMTAKKLAFTRNPRMLPNLAHMILIAL